MLSNIIRTVLAISSESDYWIHRLKKKKDYWIHATINLLLWKI